MTLVELGALGEFVGSIAVLATLIYLAIQTRQTKFAAQSAARHTAAATMNQNTQNAAASDEYAEIVSRGFADQDLEPAQWLRFGLWMTGMFHVFQQHYLDSEQGLGDRRVWAGEERAMRDLLGNPGVARWWREIPARPYSDVFTDHVNKLLASAEETDEFRRYRELREQS
jgi:hypothetical protein